MSSFDIIGQARLDAAEGQRELSHAFVNWLGRVARHWLSLALRHRPGSRVTPW